MDSTNNSHDEEELKKETHSQIELWQPVIKSPDGKYIAILSDDSLDRDGEIVGKSALMKIKDTEYIVGLMDHENKVLNQVCEWTNKRIENINGHTAFVAEPKFFESNPNAKIIRGMLDEGAKLGISIGALVKDFKFEKINGKDVKTYTDLEILEASYCAIPSNRHGRAMAVAKMFKNKMEEDVMDEVEKVEFAKKLETSNKETEDVKKLLEVEKANALVLAGKVSELEKSLEAEKAGSIEKDAKFKVLEKEFADFKASPVFKALNSTPERNEPVMKDGELPVLKR